MKKMNPMEGQTRATFSFQCRSFRPSETTDAAATLARCCGRGRPPLWRRFSNLRVHGTFPSRVPVRRATALMPFTTIPIFMSPRGANPAPPPGKVRNTGQESAGSRRQESRRYDSRSQTPANRAQSRQIQPDRGKSSQNLSRVPAGLCSALQSSGAWLSRFPFWRLLCIFAASQSAHFGFG